MLIKFTFENFKSYKVENEISMVSYTKIRSQKTHQQSVNGLSILKYIGIYGNNATGKSTVLEAVKFYQGFITNTISLSQNITFKGMENQPTRFSAFFSIESEIYQYSFSIISSNNKKISINDEEIAVIGSGPRRGKIIYSKKSGISKSYIESDNEKVFGFIYDGYKTLNKGSNVESLFLSYACQDDKIIIGSKLSTELKKIFDYIKNNIVVIGANTTNLNFIKPEFENVINKYITQFDKGLEKVELTNLSEIEYETYIPLDIRDDVFRYLETHKGKGVIISNNNRTFVFVNKTDNTYSYRALKSKHKYINESFDFSEESEGTRKFITLMSYFATKRKEVTFFIDELERSMHPDACDYLFSFFENETKKANSQFIFTSHNERFIKTNLRRDEIYFTDKDMFGGSIIYPQTDFKSVTSTNIAKKFLNGDYRKVGNNGPAL